MKMLCMHRSRQAHSLWASTAVCMVLASALVDCGPRNGAATVPAPSRADPVVPAGAEGLAGVEWVRVPTPGGKLTAAVARPPGTGPFPALVLLHGSHGFAREYVRLAQDLARECGVVAVAGCWFKGGQGAGRQFVTPIACPDAPEMPAAASDEALEIVDALMTAVRDLPGVRGDRIALFGQSRGGGAALHYVFERGGVWVAVLNSTGYPQEVVDRAGAVSAPLLLLHGKADSPTDGGSERTAVDRARKFEDALRREGKPVKAVYFDGGHNGLFADAKQYDESVRLIAAFLREYLDK